MEDERGGTASDGVTFARSLDTLKREGSNILLVGAETAGAHEAVCQRLLGEADRDSIYRLRVTGGETRVACEGGCTAPGADAPEPTRSRTIDYSSVNADLQARGAGDASRPLPSALGAEIIEAVDAFADAADGLAPAELRVCVDSLVPLCHEYDVETVFRLLHVTTSRVDRARGMGHYHLPLARDHGAISLFEPLFDAIITVRSSGGTAEQRWYLRETETTTDWLKL